jgi:hypothetical protein
MAESFTISLDNGTTSDSNTYTSATFTPAPVCGLLVNTSIDNSTEPAVPSSVSSPGMTYTEVTNVYYKPSTGTSRLKIIAYIGVGSPTSGTLSINYGYTAAGNRWTVVDLGGAASASTVVQFAVNDQALADAATLSAVLASGTPGDAGNRCLTFVGYNLSTASYTPRASWTELSDTGHGTPSMANEVQWRSDQFEQTGSVTNASGQTTRTGIITMEIKIATVADVAGQRNRGLALGEGKAG